MTHLADSAWDVCACKEGSLWCTTSGDQQVDTLVQLPQEEQAQEGHVLLALLLAEVHQLLHAVCAALG